MTSNLLSILNDLSDVAAFIQSCISSKKIRVSPGTNWKLGLIRDIFLIIVLTSKPLSKIVLYCLSMTKLISTIFL